MQKGVKYLHKGCFMYYNIKNEKIYYMSTETKNMPLNIYLAGITLPNPNYIITHNTTSNDKFNRYQFEYVTKGTGYIIIDNKTITLKEGDFFFLNRNNPRIFYADKKDPWEKMFITVNGPLIDHLIATYKMDSPLIVSHTDVSMHFYQILKILGKDHELPVEAYEETSVELLRIIQKINRDKKLDTETDIICCAEHIMSYIDQNIYRKFTLNELAEYFFLSKAQIIRIFSDQYKMTPMQYAIAKRIALATYYLSKSNISISALSEMLAFSDSKHFSKTFKKYVNKTPREYRKSTFEIQEKNIENLRKSINM